MRPRSELRVAAKAWQGPEDLDPHFLCDVGREIRIVADEPPHDDIDVRRMTGPKGPHRRLIAREGSLYGELFGLHDVQRIGHDRGGNGCRGNDRGEGQGWRRSDIPWRPRPYDNRAFQASAVLYSKLSHVRRLAQPSQTRRPATAIISSPA
jgi:hypothetical protein